MVQIALFCAIFPHLGIRGGLARVLLAGLLLVWPMSSRSNATKPNSATVATEWQALELLLMREVMRLVGQSLAPEVVLREMLHLMSELPGLNRGRIVLADCID